MDGAGSYLVAFGGDLVSFLSPCVLPLVKLPGSSSLSPGHVIFCGTLEVAASWRPPWWPHEPEMIHEASLAMRTRMFAGRLAQSSHAYPTWSMAVQKAAA